MTLADAGAYPTTPIVRYWRMVEQLQRGAANISQRRAVVGHLDEDALEAACRALVARHEVLRCALVRARTRFPDGDWRGLYLDYRLVVDPSVTTLPIDHCSASDLETGAPFRLSRAPLMRVRVASDGGSDLVALTCHHSISDAWSQALLWRDLALFYARARGHNVPELEPAPSFGAHAAAELRRREEGSADRHAAFWRERLAGVTPAPLPPAHNGDGEAIVPYGYHGLQLSPAEHDAMTKFARRLRATPFAVLLSAYALALRDVFGWRDVVIHLPWMNRRDRQARETVGSFANLLLFPLTRLQGRSLEDVVALTSTLLRGAIAHGSATLDAIGEDALRVAQSPRIAIRQQLWEIESRWRVPPVFAPPPRDVWQPANDFGGATDLRLDVEPLGGSTHLNFTYRRATVQCEWVGAVVSALRATLSVSTDATA